MKLDNCQYNMVCELFLEVCGGGADALICVETAGPVRPRDVEQVLQRGGQGGPRPGALQPRAGRTLGHRPLQHAGGHSYSDGEEKIQHFPNVQSSHHSLPVSGVPGVFPEPFINVSFVFYWLYLTFS